MRDDTRWPTSPEGNPLQANFNRLVENLARHVDRLARSIGPRHVGHPTALTAAATLIERELAQSGYVVQRQRYLAGGVEVANLIAELPGTSRADEIVILGAHYDTVPTTPGADDNASAVAVLLEVARLMRPAEPARTVRFVAFACEEVPHFYTGEMGSQVYARGCRSRNERVIGMLCLEMVGYYTSAPGSQQIPAGIPEFLRGALPECGNFLAAVGNLPSAELLQTFERGFKEAVEFPLFAIALPAQIPEINLSDNSAFWEQGYPALMLTDTSFLRNPHYHLPSDTPDTLDYASMAQVALGVLGGLSAAALSRLPEAST